MSRLILMGCLLGLCLEPLSGAETANSLPKFDEFYQLLRKELKILNPEQLDQAVVKGLLRELQNQVFLVTNSGTNELVASGPLISKKETYDGAYGYLRVSLIAPEIGQQLGSAFHALNSSNKLKGLVLDLRYAEGTNYEAAAEAASLFLSKEQPLLEMGSQIYRSKTTNQLIDLPVTVLMNQQTKGAAEALAAILRNTQAALLLGGSTAGQIGIFQDFNLSDGQKIKLLSLPARLPGNQTNIAQGIKPDIEITVPAEEERLFFEDPFRTTLRSLAFSSGTATTNRPARRRLNEAELVRQQRESNPEGNSTPDRALLDNGAVITDPPLARAVDLLKGLSVVRKLQSK